MKSIRFLCMTFILLLPFLGQASGEEDAYVRIGIARLNGRATECFASKCDNLWCKIPHGTYARIVEQGKGPGVRVQILAPHGEDLICCGLPVWVYRQHVESVPPSTVPSNLTAPPVPAGYLHTDAKSCDKGRKNRDSGGPSVPAGIGSVCKGCNLNLIQCAAARSEQCSSVLKTYQCCQSPWRGVPVQDRLHYIMDVMDNKLRDPSIFQSEDPKTTKRRDLSCLDKYTVACMIFKETAAADPLSVTRIGCGRNTASGLGHVNKPTLRELVKKGFVSASLPRTSGESDTKYFDELWRAYGKDPDLQLEVMTAVLKRKAEFSSLAWDDYSFLDQSFGLRQDQWAERKRLRVLAHYYGAGDTARLESSIAKLEREKQQATNAEQEKRIDRKNPAVARAHTRG